MPCRVSGCKSSWIWFGSQQVRSLGQSPPERMCDHHLAQLNELADVDVNCRNPGCPNTWVWKRGAQLAQLAKFGKLKRPARLCDECFASERETTDQEVACKVDTCLRTWTWTREAQLRHRLWVRRQWLKAEKAAARARREAEERAEAKAAAVEAKAAAAEAAAVAAEAKTAEAKADQDETPASPADADAPGTDASAALGSADAAPESASSANSADAVVEASTTEEVAVEETATDASATEASATEASATEATATEASTTEASATEASTTEATEASATAEEKSASDEAPVGGDEEPAKRKRRRRRRRGKKGKAEAVPEVAAMPAPVEIPEGPPARMCACCSQKVAKIEVRELPCKVHGCTRTWSWDRASQLRAWAALGTDDLSAEPQPPRRMCETCREFCRSQKDQEIPCGRPGCENSWTHKVGAQLQAALAGRTQVPMRLCDECSRGGFISSLQAEGQELPPGAERMPCVVSGCAGSWVWFPGQKVLATQDKDGLEVGKMCLNCRHERGFDLEVVEPTASEDGGASAENAELTATPSADGSEAAASAEASAGSTEASSESAAEDVSSSTAEGDTDADADADAAGQPAPTDEPAEPSSSS